MKNCDVSPGDIIKVVQEIYIDNKYIDCFKWAERFTLKPVFYRVVRGNTNNGNCLLKNKRGQLKHFNCYVNDFELIRRAIK